MLSDISRGVGCKGRAEDSGSETQEPGALPEVGASSQHGGWGPGQEDRL